MRNRGVNHVLRGPITDRADLYKGRNYGGDIPARPEAVIQGFLRDLATEDRNLPQTPKARHLLAAALLAENKHLLHPRISLTSDTIRKWLTKHFAG